MKTISVADPQALPQLLGPSQVVSTRIPKPLVLPFAQSAKSLGVDPATLHRALILAWLEAL